LPVAGIINRSLIVLMTAGFMWDPGRIAFAVAGNKNNFIKKWTG
jgi:hypothetical protein